MIMGECNFIFMTRSKNVKATRSHDPSHEAEVRASKPDLLPSVNIFYFNNHDPMSVYILLPLI